MRTLLAETDDDALADGLRMERGAPAATRGRHVRRRFGPGIDPLPQRGAGHAARNVTGQRAFRKMLQLTPAAGWKMAANRIGMVGAMRKRAIGFEHVARRGERYVTAISRGALAFGGDANDKARRSHDRAFPSAARTPIARSVAVKAGPLSRAASPCSHTPSQAAAQASP